MSYIAFELDALNAAPAVARSSGVAEEVIIAGLVRMWAWCFREKTDTITADQLRGHFGADVAPALVAFRFLEAQDSGWRVRGAQRYLRINEGRSKGGKAASGNLKRGKRKPGGKPEESPGLVPAAAGEQPESSPGLFPALHRAPNTEHRTPLKDSAPASRAPRESDGLVEDFETVIGSKYQWQGAKDGAALAGLRKHSSIDEIRSRWRAGLRADGWLSVRTVAQLASKWNDLATLAPKLSPQGPACVGCGGPGVTGWPELGVPTCHPCGIEAIGFSAENGLVPYVDGATKWLEHRRRAA